ncbi:MAG: hypothetical protein R3248_03600 [Candidatus Promineifilaceae bacterium]|nr:hypothetical protein [Candidatus Promineifilaceae bacterium]
MRQREILIRSFFVFVAVLLAAVLVAAVWYAFPRHPSNQVRLSLDDYPPSETPYLHESKDFWLVHTSEGDLSVFVPVAPEYAPRISIDECRYDWNRAIGRFIDPCSGDEWQLDGRLNLTHSTELWSSRDLDRYATTIEGTVVTVHLGQTIPGAPLERPRPDSR